MCPIGRSWNTARRKSPTAPSGTATELAEQLSAVRPPVYAIPPDKMIGPAGARGADIHGTRVHAVRLPGLSAACEVIFGMPGERIAIRHDMQSSDAIFVEGTLLAARKVRDFKGVVRGLDKRLFGKSASPSHKQLGRQTDFTIFGKLPAKWVRRDVETLQSQYLDRERLASRARPADGASS
ncbi:MAG: dihydrodipicolinate reductase C-terminal domain-containing protein [Alphaproteobacteria bacterium]